MRGTASGCCDNSQRRPDDRPTTHAQCTEQTDKHNTPGGTLKRLGTVWYYTQAWSTKAAPHARCNMWCGRQSTTNITAAKGRRVHNPERKQQVHAGGSALNALPTVLAAFQCGTARGPRKQGGTAKQAAPPSSQFTSSLAGKNRQTKPDVMEPQCNHSGMQHSTFRAQTAPRTQHAPAAKQPAGLVVAGLSNAERQMQRGSTAGATRHH